MFSLPRSTVSLFITCRTTAHHHRSLNTSSLWSVVEGAESLLTTLHVQSSLPWWAVLTGSTIVLRSALTLPLAVYQQKIGARIELLRPLLKEYSDAIVHNVVVKCRRQGLPVEEANRRIRKEVWLNGRGLMGVAVIVHRPGQECSLLCDYCQFSY